MPCRSKIARASPRRRERLVVPAQGDQALQRAVQRARHVDVASQRAETASRAAWWCCNATLVLAPGVMDVTDGSQALRAAALVIELLGDPLRRLRQALRAVQVGPRQPHDAGVQPFDDGRRPRAAGAGEESCARARAVRTPASSIDQLVVPGRSARGGRGSYLHVQPIQLYALEAPLLQRPLRAA